jgi:hypothetical protein
MLEFRKPIPVIVEENKEGYAIYVSNSGTFENDVWCVALCNGGAVRHYTSDQIKIHYNGTFGIKVSEESILEIMRKDAEKSKPHFEDLQRRARESYQEYLTSVSKDTSAEPQDQKAPDQDSPSPGTS